MSIATSSEIGQFSSSLKSSTVSNKSEDILKRALYGQAQTTKSSSKLITTPKGFPSNSSRPQSKAPSTPLVSGKMLTNKNKIDTRVRESNTGSGRFNKQDFAKVSSKPQVNEKVFSTKKESASSSSLYPPSEKKYHQSTGHVPR